MPRRLVLVFGSYMQDQVFRCAEFPVPGQTVKGTLATGPGGKGSNQAIAAGRMGAATLFVGAVGADGPGRDAAATYRREKIGCKLIVKAGVPTGTAGIWVNGRGANEIIIAPGANERLAAEDVSDRELKSAAIVVTQLEGDPAAVATVLKRARKLGAATVLNPAPLVARLDLRLLRAVDILIPNETEFVGLMARLGKDLDEATLSALSPEEVHTLCRALGVSTVVVTLGARGCLVSTADRHEFLAAHRGIKVIDTTGAGDAFCGGFAAGFVRFQGDVFAAARLGNAAGALSVTAAGAAPSMPTARAVAKLLGRRA
jgi:ribokinase